MMEEKRMYDPELMPQSGGQPVYENAPAGMAPQPQSQPAVSPQDAWRMEEERRRREEERQRQVGAQLFGRLASASLIYTLIYTFCLYQNLSGITAAIWVPALLGYTYYVFRISDLCWKRDSTFVVVVMALLGVSNFLTGNKWILWLNYVAVFLLVVALLLHNFCRDEQWDFGKYLLEIGTAVCGAIGSMFRPFTDGGAYIRVRKEKNAGNAGAGWYVAAGIGIAVPCLIFLGILLASADLVFADMIERFFLAFLRPEKIFGIAFMLLFGFFSSYCGVRFIRAHADQVTVKDHRTGEPLIAITVTALIALLYLVFCLIQVVYLFLGNMQLPEGVTYAQYARRGFFQLLYVCVLNLILVLAVKKFFRESRLLNVILFVISGCTLVMTASSAYRMLLYIGAYQLTFLRIFVLVALLVIALLMAGVMCVIVKPQFPLFRYGIVVVSVVYLAFSFSHVDYFIAKYNLSQEDVAYSGRTAVDYAYIDTLSTDAAPAIDAYLEDHPAGTWLDRYLKENEQEIHEITIRNFNVSHYIAHRLFGER